MVCAIRPDPTRVYPIIVTLADDQQILNGASESKSKGDLEQIRKWNASPADVTLFTPDEPDGKAVLFMPGSLRVKQSSHESGRRPSYEVSFLLAEVLGWR